MKVLTMRAVVGDSSTHAHGRSTLEQSLCDNRICLGDARKWASNGQDTVVDTLDNL